VVYDLNGLTRERWDKLPANYEPQGDPRWDGFSHARRRPQSPAAEPEKREK